MLTKNKFNGFGTMQILRSSFTTDNGKIISLYGLWVPSANGMWNFIPGKVIGFDALLTMSEFPGHKNIENGFLPFKENGA